MQIDLQTEQIGSLTEAAKWCPPIDGRRPHVSTLWRWCRKGLRGVQLEYVRLGHRVCTSKEALTRFAQRLVERDHDCSRLDPPLSPPPTRPSDQRRQRDIQRAEARLREAGF